MIIVQIENPCDICSDYPHHCRGICIAKQMYLNEVDEDVPVIKRSKRKKKSKIIASVFYKNGKAYEYNKNGIMREVSIR